MKQLNKILSLLLALFIVIGMLPMNVLATNSYDQDYEGNMGTNVSYTGGGTEGYKVTVPATLAPGASGNVTVEGTWASNRVLNVTSDEKVTLTNNIDNSLTKELVVTFGGISKVGSNTVAIKTTDEGAYATVSVSEITNALFGTWSGTFYYNVEMEDVVRVPVSVSATNSAGENLNATANVIVGSEETDLLNKLEDSGLVKSANDVAALIEVESDDFDNLATTTFDVSSIAETGDKVVILHFNETTQEWEFIAEETVNAEGKVTANFSSYSPVAFVVVKADGTMEVIPIVNTNLITFTLQGGYTFQAEKGMTWEDWVNSDYNTLQFASITSDGNVNIGDYDDYNGYVLDSIKFDGADYVISTDEIIDGHVYGFEWVNVELITFSIIEKSTLECFTYYAEADMTWADWIESEYNCLNAYVDADNRNRIVFDFENLSREKYRCYMLDSDANGAATTVSTDAIIDGQNYGFEIISFQFTIRDESSKVIATCQADVGMTWAEWIDSDYNIVGAYIDADKNYIRLQEYAGVLLKGSMTQYSSDTVLPNVYYFIVYL